MSWLTVMFFTHPERSQYLQMPINPFLDEDASLRSIWYGSASRDTRRCPGKDDSRLWSLPTSSVHVTCTYSLKDVSALQHAMNDTVGGLIRSHTGSDQHPVAVTPTDSRLSEIVTNFDEGYAACLLPFPNVPSVNRNFSEGQSVYAFACKGNELFGALINYSPVDFVTFGNLSISGSKVSYEQHHSLAGSTRFTFNMRLLKAELNK